MKNLKTFEKYNYDPKTFYQGKELDPNTPDNQKAKIKKLESAKKKMEAALEDLLAIPRTDWFEEIPDMIRDLRKFIGEEDNEDNGGISRYIKILKDRK